MPVIEWKRIPASLFFHGVTCGGQPVGSGLLTASCCLQNAPGETLRLGGEVGEGRVGLCHVGLEHRLRHSFDGEDTLEARLRVRNLGHERQTLRVEFASPVGAASRGDWRVHLPLSAGGLATHPVLQELGRDHLLEPEQTASRKAPLVAHYLEPLGSDAPRREAQALLLIPLLDILAVPCRCALFVSPERPWRVAVGEDNEARLSAWVTLEAGEEAVESCFLLLHQGNAWQAWRAFHELAHHDPHPRIAWLDEVRVHYYDFLSSDGGQTARRGRGFEADAAHFREFRVGLATQHGYYPSWGDYLHPDRPTWTAMRGDPSGAVEMSLATMRERCRLTRQMGARAAIYIHAAGFDDASPIFESLRDAARVKADGAREAIYWRGPDTAGNNWHLSIAAPQWREHLLRQVAWIMELLDPDAIVVDETFAGLGYDHHPDRNGAISSHMIAWMKELRALVRSFGAEKAVLSSDCGYANFALWADGEAGDHAYAELLGHEAYRRAPARYRAALGDKPWLPGAWHFQEFWQEQIELARQSGASVGVSNGWLEYSGLARLPGEARARLLHDIHDLKHDLKAVERP